jgi:hypothetical protein
VAQSDFFWLTPGSPLVIPAPGVLANDTDIDGPVPGIAQLVSGPSVGTLLLNSDGSFTYTAGPGFINYVLFTYRAGDGTAWSAPVTVRIQESGINYQPEAVTDIYNLPSGQTSVTVAAPGVLANDIDEEALPQTERSHCSPTVHSLTKRPRDLPARIHSPTA